MPASASRTSTGSSPISGYAPRSARACASVRISSIVRSGTYADADVTSDMTTPPATQRHRFHRIMTRSCSLLGSFHVPFRLHFPPGLSRPFRRLSMRAMRHA
jgi:hypothetical protein